MTVQEAKKEMEICNELMLYDFSYGEEIPYESLNESNKKLYDAHVIAIGCMEEVEQYRALGTVEELKAKVEELERWHTDRINENIKNEFANKSTLICHNCDHKDEYIEEIESEIAKQSKLDWIPYTVGGERPCNIQKVWLSFSNELCSFVKQAWWMYDHFEWNNGKRVKDCPTAWMPYIVPQPYKKEGGEDECN